MQRKIILSLLFASAARLTLAQSHQPVKSISESSLDSLSIFQLIDSLVQAPSAFELGSTLVARMGYNSNIVAASRTLGFNQFGLAPGISYYHKSGLYLDATAYWSQGYQPNLYLTIPSIGYIKGFKKWTMNFEYSKYAYSFSDSTYLPYTNSLDFSNFFDLKPFLFRLDYSLYFGQKTAHRIMPGVMLNLEKRNWHGIKRILLYPTFNVLMGNETWQTENFVLQGRILYRQIENHNKFGVLNYSASVPLNVSLKNWNFVLSYTYNFQQALRGEPITLTNSGYISFSIIRYFNFKSHSVLTDLLKMTK